MQEKFYQEAMHPSTSMERFQEILEKEPTLLYQIAKNPETKPSFLEALAKNADTKTQIALVANPNTPSAILFRLGEKFPKRLIKNPIFSLLLLETDNSIFKNISYTTLQNILQLKRLPPLLLEKAARHENSTVRALVSRHAKTPPLLLEELAKDRAHWVRSEVLHSPNISEKILEILLVDESEKIREKALAHPKAPQDFLTFLSRAVRSIAKENTKIPSANLVSADIETLLAHGPYARALAARQPNLTRAQVASLVCDPSVVVRAAIAGHDKLSHKELQSLYLDKVAEVRVAVAENPLISIEMMREISKKNLKSERLALLKNPKISSEILSILLGDETKEIRSFVLTHPKIPKNTLALFYQAGASQDLLTISSPKGPVDRDTLQLLAERRGYAQALVAQNLNTPPELLEAIFQKSKYSVTIQTCLAKNPNLPRELFEKLARTYHKDTKIALAKNPYTPADILALLLADDSLEVREAAALHSKTCKKLRKLLQRAEKQEKLTQKEFQKLSIGGVYARILVVEHPDVSEKLLENLVAQSHWKVIDALAKKANTPIHILEKVTKIIPHATAITLAENPKISSAMLETFSQSYSIEIVYSASQNPNLSAASLEKLSRHEACKIRRSVAAHTNTDSLLLEKLSGDERQEVQIAVAQNRNTPQNTLKRLLASRYLAVRQAARDNSALCEKTKESFLRAGAGNDFDGNGLPDPLMPGALLLELATCGYFAKYLAARHTNTPKQLFFLLEKEEEKPIRMALAKNPSTPQEILSRLLQEKSARVRRVAAENPSAPSEVLLRLLRAGSNAHMNQIDTVPKSLSPQEIEKLKAGGPWARALLAAYPALDKVTLFTLAKDPIFFVRVGVAKNPNTPTDLQKELLRDPVWKVRYQLAIQKTIAPFLLLQLCEDTHKKVRMAVLKQSNTPKTGVRKLLQDRHKSVRRLAKHRLQSQ